MSDINDLLIELEHKCGWNVWMCWAQRLFQLTPVPFPLFLSPWKICAFGGSNWMYAGWMLPADKQIQTEWKACCLLNFIINVWFEGNFVMNVMAEMYAADFERSENTKMSY